MPVTVIVGGQFGSEGKGKVAYILAQEMQASIAVRIGGPNSGHTVCPVNGPPRIFRHLPTACLLPETRCVIGAGSYIDVEILLREIEGCRLARERLIIDEHAVLIGTADRNLERAKGMRQTLGSTLSGTGAAVARRIWRAGDVQFARHDSRLQPFIGSSLDVLDRALNRGERIIVEGTQGFGLSVLHSPYYPKATSRDTTASACLSEAGLSPLHVDDVVLVIRAFPIRVAGDSGELPNEIDWETVTRESGGDQLLLEHTSATNQVRRVGRFHPDIVKKAIAYNAPTRVVLNHVDYIDSKGVSPSGLSDKAIRFVEYVEASIGRRVDYLGICNKSLISSKNLATQRVA